MLLVFAVLPATGKSTISKAVTRTLGAMHVRIDTIEQEPRNTGVLDVGSAGSPLP